MSYIQETNSVRVPPPLSEDSLFILDGLDGKDETDRGRSDLRFMPLSVQRLTIPAWSASEQVEDQMVAGEATRILWSITETILVFQNQGFDLGHLPQIHAFPVQDGSLLIEWIFDDFRVGFSIEPNVTESSWYLVSNSKLGDVNVAGIMSQGESETQFLMVKLLAFVFFHV